MVMRTLRNKVSLILWLSVILLLAMVVGLVAPGFMSGGRDLAGAAAVVNGHPIDAQAFSRLLDSRLAQARQALGGGDLDDAQSAKIRRDALNDLISQQLALDHARGLGLAMSESEFRQTLLDDPELQDSQGHFDQARYEQILEQQAEQGIPWRQAEAGFRRAMLMDKVRTFWADQAVLTPRERALALERFNRQVRATAVVWDLKALTRAEGPKLSLDDLETYYSLHKRDWEKPESRHLRQIRITEELGESTATARAKADAALARLAAGTPFKAVAAKFNSDPDARKSGGDLGWLTQDDLREPAVADTAFRLAPGRHSGVLATRNGYVIVAVEGIRPGFEPTFANSRAKAAAALALARARAAAAEDADRALALIAEGKGVADAARATGGRVVETGWFGLDDARALPVLGRDPGFAQELLRLDVGQATRGPLSGPGAVAVAVLSAQRPGPAPKDPKAAAARESEALDYARGAKAKALYDAWIAGLRAKADIVDQTGALGGTGKD